MSATYSHLVNYLQKTIHEWHKKLGPTIKLYMGTETWIFIADPVLAHKVLVTHATATSFRPHSHSASSVYSRNKQ